MSYYGKTLPKMVKKLLDDNGYFSDEKTVKAASDYIEGYNITEDDVLTPQDWLKMTKEAFPETLINKDDYYKKVIWALNKQRKLCLDQTGCEPDIWDYSEVLLSDEWEEKFSVHLDITDIFTYLLEFYIKEVCSL